MPNYDCSKCNARFPPYSFPKKYYERGLPRVCWKCDGAATLVCSSCKAVLPKSTGGYYSAAQRNSATPRCTICCNNNRTGQRDDDDDLRDEGNSGMYLGHGEWDTPSGAEGH